MDRGKIAEVLRQNLATANDVAVAYLFGSIARGSAHSLSDIDVGVVFKDSLNPAERLFRRISLSQCFEDRFGQPVDVVDLRETSPQFNHYVLCHKVVLKGHDDPIRIDFEKSVRRHYFDMIPHIKRFEDARLMRFMKGGDGRGRRAPDSGTLEAARRIHQRLRERSGE